MSESQSKGERSSGEDVNVGQFVSKSRLVTSESAFFVKKLVEVFTKEKKAKQRIKVSRPYDRAAEISVLQVSCLKKNSNFCRFSCPHCKSNMQCSSWSLPRYHRLSNIDLRRNQRAEEAAAQAVVDEDQDDDYVPNSSQNEDDDNSFFSDSSCLNDVFHE